MNYKSKKYKLKILYSLKEKNFEKINIYFKKYFQYRNNKLLNFQYGGTDINITSQDDLNNLMNKIKQLLNTILNPEITDKIFNELNESMPLNTIKTPTKLNLDNFIREIFETNYKKEDDIVIKQIDNIINDMTNEIKKEKPEKKEIKNFQYLSPIIVDNYYPYYNPINFNYNSGIVISSDSFSSDSDSNSDSTDKDINKHLKKLKKDSNIVVY